MVSIDQCTLRITTDIAVHTYAFTTAEELSQALLILSLSGTRKVEDKDDARFNPARFLPGYEKKNPKAGRLAQITEPGFLTDGPARWSV